MLHVAIDGKRYYLNQSGLGRYSRTLVKGLLDCAKDAQLRVTLFKPAGEVLNEAPEHPALKVHPISSVIPGDAGNAYWRFVTLPRILERQRFSLFHGPSHVLPRKNSCPMIVTMFDLIFLRFPRYFPLWDRHYYRRAFAASSRVADHIISISQSTKSDLVEFFSLKPEKISVIYPAFSSELSPVSEPMQSEIRQRFGLDFPYILYVGTIEPRKNLVRLARAFSNLVQDPGVDRKLHLVITGRKGWFYKEIIKEIAQLPANKRIVFTGPAYGADLAGIYQMASCVAYVSLFEGFGYPILEAMSLGAAVITSSISSMPEAAGSAAILVDPESEEQITEALLTVISDESLANSLRKKGYAQARSFSLERQTQQTIELYRRFTR